MSVRRAMEADRERWLELRAALFPDQPLEHHDATIGGVLAGSTRRAAFLFSTGAARDACGLVEVSRDGEGGAAACLEALYVVPAARRAGVARTLLEAAGDWAARGGCVELRCRWPAADETAHAGLRALDFVERAREVQFARLLHPAMALAAERPQTAGRAPDTAATRRIDDAEPRRNLLHGLVVAAGVASLLMTDLFSGDPLRGALLPLLDVLFAVYLLAMLAGRQYRRRTDSNDRSARLFETLPPRGPGGRLE